MLTVGCKDEHKDVFFFEEKGSPLGDWISHLLRNEEINESQGTLTTPLNCKRSSNDFYIENHISEKKKTNFISKILTLFMAIPPSKYREN